MTLPDYVLAIDPAGKQENSAFCLSCLTTLNTTIMYEPLLTGIFPTIERGGIPQPDTWPFTKFRRQLKKKYPGTIDLVIERYVGRGHTGWISEHIAFTMGAWAAVWNLGAVRCIMASQWKKPLTQFGEQYDYTSANPKYANWWEDHYSYFYEADRIKRGDKHVQDACGIGYWYWGWELEVDCYPQPSDILTGD